MSAVAVRVPSVITPTIRLFGEFPVSKRVEVWWCWCGLGRAVLLYRAGGQQRRTRKDLRATTPASCLAAERERVRGRLHIILSICIRALRPRNKPRTGSISPGISNCKSNHEISTRSQNHELLLEYLLVADKRYPLVYRGMYSSATAPEDEPVSVARLGWSKSG